MEKIYQSILARLKACGISEVYPSFDAVPVARKSQTLFTVLSLQRVQFGEAYPAEGGAVYPFTADFRISMLTPMTADPQDTARFFFSAIVPAMLGTDCLFVKFDAQNPSIDLKLGRMVFGGQFCLNGAFRVTETEGTA